jgi:hypothetical protein
VVADQSGRPFGITVFRRLEHGPVLGRLVLPARICSQSGSCRQATALTRAVWSRRSSSILIRSGFPRP